MKSLIGVICATALMTSVSAQTKTRHDVGLFSDVGLVGGDDA